MPPAHSIWTEAKVEYLRQLWADGYVARAIADELGVTRNAVIGKAYRLRLERRLPPQPRPKPTIPRPRLVVVKPAKPRTPAVPQPKPSPPKPSPPSLPREPPPPPRMRRLKLVELAVHHCRWPIGEPQHPDFCFCAANTRDGAVYCTHHMRLAFARPKGG